MSADELVFLRAKLSIARFFPDAQTLLNFIGETFSSRINNGKVIGDIADVYGKTVDDFRWAVQQRINELKVPQLMPLADAVNVLVAKGIVNTPDYWVQNAVNGKSVNGEYTGLLIQKVAEKLK